MIRIRPGETMKAANYIELMKLREQFIRTINAAASGYDAMLMPTTPDTARFDNEEEQEWIKSVETFCRTPPAWAGLLLPAQRFGASSLFSPKAGQDMNSPR